MTQLNATFKNKRRGASEAEKFSIPSLTFKEERVATNEIFIYFYQGYISY